MCVVIDLDVVCLVCLQPSKDLHPIFTPTDDDPELYIAQKISILSELKVDQNNQTLPRKICTKCLQDLKAAWRFRKNCKSAVTIFQTIDKLGNKQSESIIQAKEPEENSDVNTENGLQILLTCINTDNEEGDTKKPNESLIIKKSESGDEFLVKSDEIKSALYDELETTNCMEGEDNDAQEFQELDEASEKQQNECFENDESNLVEYYLTEESMSQDMNAEGAQEIEKKHDIEESQIDSTTYIVNVNKSPTRGRPRKQNLVQDNGTKSNFVQTKTRGKLVLESANSSASVTHSQISQVKTRKRSSSSSDKKSPKICELCGNTYRYQHALNAHMRRHFNDKPFRCECCDKAFVSNVELRRHLRVHTGQKPYACQYCDRRFSDYGSRIKHERSHTGERPYVCITCGKAFAYAHVLSVHVRIHTGVKRFRCDYCDKGFTKKSYLIAHVNSNHPKKELDDVNTNETKKELDDFIFTPEFVDEDANEAVDGGEEYDEDVKYGTSKETAKQPTVGRRKVKFDSNSHVYRIEMVPKDFDM